MPYLTNGKFVMSLVMLAIFLGMVLMSLSYPPDSRLLPLVIGIPGIVLALVQVLMEFLAIRNEHGKAPALSENGDPQTLSPVRKEVVLFGYLIGLMILLLFLGFWISVPIFLVAFLRFNERFPWPKVAIMTAIGLGSLYLVFQVILGIVPHEGFLVDYFSE